ncbi:MAG: hypothetical protein GY753_07670 [Gammaproteobacteria bacterium]|nr:hypothetical protein [Gammaproteobacteria bacterium]
MPTLSEDSRKGQEARAAWEFLEDVFADYQEWLLGKVLECPLGDSEGLQNIHKLLWAKGQMEQLINQRIQNGNLADAQIAAEQKRTD